MLDFLPFLKGDNFDLGLHCLFIPVFTLSIWLPYHTYPEVFLLFFSENRI